MNKKRNDDPGIDLRKYNNPRSVSMKKVNIGLWFMKNKRNFFLILIISLIAGSIIIYSYFFYNLYDYIRYSAEERQAMKELSESELVLGPGRVAEPIKEISFKYFFHNNKYDFIAQVENPNSNFIAYLNYCFIDGGLELACAESFIFPEDKKDLVILSQKIDKCSSGVKFKIKNIKWERLNARQFPDWKKFYNERSNFSFLNIDFTNKGDVGNLKSNNLSFTLRNNSPYNYWELPLVIILYSRGTIVGVNKYLVVEINSLEERVVNLSWPDLIPAIDRVEIKPQLNVLDDNNYIKYK